MYRSEKLIVCCFALTLLGGLATGAAAANDDASASGSFWYENRASDGEVYTMDLEIVDAIALRDELIGGKRVNVVLVGKPIEREALLEELAKAGNLKFTLTRMGMRDKVLFDVCSDAEGKEVEVCGLYFSGPGGLSRSSSGFGVYGKWVESISFDGDRVSAKLRTTSDETEGDGELTYRFNLEFDVPVIKVEKKK